MVEILPLSSFPEPLDDAETHEYADRSVRAQGSFRLQKLAGGITGLRFAHVVRWQEA